MLVYFFLEQTTMQIYQNKINTRKNWTRKQKTSQSKYKIFRYIRFKHNLSIDESLTYQIDKTYSFSNQIHINRTKILIKIKSKKEM